MMTDPFQGDRNPMMEMNGIEMTKVQTSLCRQSLNRDSRRSILDGKVKLSRRDFLCTVDMTVPMWWSAKSSRQLICVAQPPI
jgi:hypothetical protein